MSLFCSVEGPLQLKIALYGNPRVRPEWTEAGVQRLVELGFNAVQLNIAWLCRPYDEALNLRDVVSLPEEQEPSRVAERRAELLYRFELAKAAGLRTFFHFGSPFMWRNPLTGEEDRAWLDAEGRGQLETDEPWYDVLRPEIVDYETRLLARFREEFSEVDDLLVYTYDQDAWQANEFGSSKWSRGIPLHKRLPGFLSMLQQVWGEGREGNHLLWWEPWELSAGQIYACLPHLPTKGFGLMLHSNIAEVQVARPVDVWLRNTAWQGAKLGMPVVVEAFFTQMTEELEPLSIPCPRLVDEEVQAIRSVPGVVGLKEYFGAATDTPDLNLDALSTRLAHPDWTTDQLLNAITERFGEAQGWVLALIETTTEAIRLYPWDASWFAREVGVASTDHGWSGATVRGQMVETPSWRSTRYSHFMMTTDQQPHPFMLEDVQLRCEACASALEQALPLADALATSAPEEVDRESFAQLVDHLDRFRRVAVSYALHLRETNVAQLLREDLAAGKPWREDLATELADLLARDVENQRGEGRVVEMQRLYAADPVTFIQRYLVPTEVTVLERGHHTLTTR